MSCRVSISSSIEFDGYPFLQCCVRAAVRRTLKCERINLPCLVNVLFTDNAGIRDLNCRFRNTDRETDVLSFPANELKAGEFDEEKCEFDYSSGRYNLGDIVISVPKCVQQSREYGHSVYREVKYLTVHSMLHLLGYDHVDEGEMKRMMRDREKTIMGDKE